MLAQALSIGWQTRQSAVLLALDVVDSAEHARSLVVRAEQYRRILRLHQIQRHQNYHLKVCEADLPVRAYSLLVAVDDELEEILIAAWVVLVAALALHGEQLRAQAHR